MLGKSSFVSEVCGPNSFNETLCETHWSPMIIAAGASQASLILRGELVEVLTNVAHGTAMTNPPGQASGISDNASLPE